MIPYLQLQILEVGLSAALALAAWWLVGRRAAIAARPLVRALSAGLVYAALAAPVYPLFSGFALVALLFYGGAIWLPLVVLGAEARRSSAGKGWSKLLAAGALAALATAGWALFVEPNRLQIAEHELALEAWAQGTPPVRIVHVSDLQTVGACARERGAAERINNMAPDLVVFSGDYVAGPFDDPEPAIEAARAFLSSLHPRLGIVCVAGHSEPRSVRERVFEGLAEIHYLEDEEIVFDLAHGRRLRVVGMAFADPAELERRIEPGLVTIVASHMPDGSASLDGRGVELHLAGHTHGGQVVIPGYGPPVTLSRLPRRYARGLFRFGDHWLNVTPGIGMEGNYAPRIRLFCPPQIDYFELVGASGPTVASY